MRSQALSQRIGFRDLAKCALGVQEAELRAYLMLLKGGPLTVQQVAKGMRRSRPTAQRILNNLVAKGLAARSESILRGGGRLYSYEAVPLERVKAMIRAIVDEWYEKFIAVLEGEGIGEPGRTSARGGGGP